MQKTTLYLPPELKKAVKELAQAREQSEADVIREAIARFTESEAPPPRVPLFRGSGRSIAERVDEALKGFGSR